MGGIKHQKWVVYHWYTQIIKITQDIHLKNIYHISIHITLDSTLIHLNSVFPVLLVFLSITRRPGPPRSRGCCEWAWSLLEFHGCIRQFHQGRSGEVPVLMGRNSCHGTHWPARTPCIFFESTCQTWRDAHCINAPLCGHAQGWESHAWASTSRRLSIVFRGCFPCWVFVILVGSI